MSEGIKEPGSNGLDAQCSLRITSRLDLECDWTHYKLFTDLKRKKESIINLN